jgi:hypothetical protein
MTNKLEVLKAAYMTAKTLHSENKNQEAYESLCNTIIELNNYVLDRRREEIEIREETNKLKQKINELFKIVTAELEIS